MLIIALLSAHTKLLSANAVAFSVNPLPDITFYEPVVSKILFNTLTTHGKNSVNNYATNFSNQDESTEVTV